jgi:hypothetical protein
MGRLKVASVPSASLWLDSTEGDQSADAAKLQVRRLKWDG